MYVKRITRHFSLFLPLPLFYGHLVAFTSHPNNGSLKRLFLPAGSCFAFGSGKPDTLAKSEIGEGYAINPNLCSADILNGFVLRGELEVFVKQSVAVVTDRYIIS